MAKLSEIFKATRRSLKRTGLQRTLQRAFQRIVPDYIFDIKHVVFIRASIKAILDESKDTPINPDLRHRWATPLDLDLLTCGGITRDAVQRMFDARGHAVITTTNHDEMVGYYWAIPGPWDSYGWVRYDVAENEFWGAHNFVMPAFRGQKVAWQSRDFSFRQLFSEGFEWGAGAVQTLNRSSVRVWSSPANRIIGEIFYIRLGTFVVYRLGRKWGAGFYAGGKPLEISAATFAAIDAANSRKID